MMSPHDPYLREPPIDRWLDRVARTAATVITSVLITLAKDDIVTLQAYHDLGSNKKFSPSSLSLKKL